MVGRTGRVPGTRPGGLSRRGVLGLGAAALAAGALSRGGRIAGAQDAPALPAITEIPEELKGSGQVVVVGYGGTFQDAQREAYFAPFQDLSGIEVIEAEGPDTSRIKAMVDTGNIEWDLTEFDRYSVLNLASKGDYWEEIDYSLFDTENIAEARRHQYSVDMMSYGQVLAYRTDAFEEAPQGWPDFWDAERFPGARTMNAGSGGLFPFLEAALIADGVPKDELYPIDIDRAFDSLSRVRDAVIRWWEAGAIPAQMLADNEVTMAEIWTGRVTALKAEGVPVEVQWNGGQFATDVWAIPKGSPNAENAQKLAAFTLLPAPQARLSILTSNGYINDLAGDLVPPDILATLPSAPEIKSQMFDLDSEWWTENADEVLARWNEWILE